MHLCWKRVWRKQFKVINLNFHTRHIPVRSPLLKNSRLVSNPPLTYMINFSGLLCLMSCSCTSRSGKLRFTMQIWISKHCNYNNWCSKHMACCTVININESVTQSVQTLTQSCPQECPNQPNTSPIPAQRQSNTSKYQPNASPFQLASPETTEALPNNGRWHRLMLSGS